MYALTLSLRPREGALIRVLGLAERRGFTPVRFDGQLSPEGDTFQMALEVASSRPLEQLIRQLHKLVDVLSISEHHQRPLRLELSR